MISLNDVLLAMSNIPVDDPIAEIWGRGLQGGYKIIEYTGSLPITITADGNALLDYRIYGNTVQDGTPTPEAPVDVVGCGMRTENLFDKDATDTSKGYIDNNAIIASGNIGQNNNFYVSEYIRVSPNTNYTWKWTQSISSVTTISMALYDDNKVLTRAISYEFYPVVSFLTSSNEVYARVTVQKSSKAISMLIEGSTAPTSYIPYGYKLPLLSGSTPVDIYLGESQTTRRIKKVVLTGEENWKKNDASPNNSLYYLSGFTDKAKADCTCTHFPQSSTPFPANNQISAKAIEDTLYIYLKNTIINKMPSGNTKEGFKEYLAAQYAAGTPVTAWYVLTEPETGIVNEPLMKIGDYADTLNMEQADVDIPTFVGETVIDYDGDPKPSQMYVKYEGKSDGA